MRTLVSLMMVALAVLVAASIGQAQDFIIDENISDFQVERFVFEDPFPFPPSGFVQDIITIPFPSAILSGGDTVSIHFTFEQPVGIIPDEIEVLAFEFLFFRDGGNVYDFPGPKFTFGETVNLPTQPQDGVLRIFNAGLADTAMRGINPLFAVFDKATFLIDPAKVSSFKEFNLNFTIPSQFDSNQYFPTVFFRVVATKFGTTTAGPMLISPKGHIDQLTHQINELVDKGTLNGGQGNALIIKLENAIKELEQGDTNVATNILQAFINQINDLIDEGVLTSGQGQPMIDAAYGVIATLGG